MTEPEELEASSVEHQVAAFLHFKGIALGVGNIEACHPLPRRNVNDPPAVIMRFVHRKKMELLQQRKKVKGSNVFLNDHLTRKNAEIARKARLLRKQNKIQNTWVSSCKIFIKLNGAPELAKVLVVRTLEELNKYD